MSPVNLIFALIICLALPSLAESGLSPLRPKDTDYRTMISNAEKSATPGVLTTRPSVHKSRLPADQVEWHKIPEVSENILQEAFEILRDEKVLIDEGSRHRRLPWLFPDSGCFARAESMANTLEDKYQISPFKLFAFGNLVAKTKYHRTGWIHWWYHVAPVVRVAEQVYVLDPSLEQTRPLKLEEWRAQLHAHPEYSICNPHSYDPNSFCDHRSDNQEDRARNDLLGFLNLEWSRLIELGINPETKLQ